MISAAFIMGAAAPTLIALMALKLDMGAAISSMGFVYVLAGILVIIALNKTFDKEYYEETQDESIQ